MKKTLRELTAGGRICTAAILQFPSEELAELLAHAGVELLILDMEHSPNGHERIVSLIRACEAAGAAAFVRVPNARDEDAIKKALDAGAAGIVIPNTDTADEARQAVDYAKFPPLGHRGACPFVRANWYGGEDRAAYYARVNESTAVIALVESPEGVRNLPEIAAVEGIDALMLGAVDLSVALGVPGQTEHPAIQAALERAAAACAANGKLLTCLASDAESAKRTKALPNVGIWLLPFPEIAIHDLYGGIVRQLRSC